MENCVNWEDDKLCSERNKLITTLKSDAKTCKAYPCGQGEYEIRDGKLTVSVSLNEKTCFCNAWKISGIPCKHAVRAIVAANLDPAKMCGDWLYVKKYKEAYGCIIKTIPDPKNWPDIDQPVIQPALMKRGVGRPTKNRKTEACEKKKGKRSKTLKCSKCNCYEHNVKTCQGGLTAKELGQANKQMAKGKKKVTTTSHHSSQIEIHLSQQLHTQSQEQ